MSRNLEITCPLGVSLVKGKITFNLYSSQAKVVKVLIYNPEKPLPVIIQELKKSEKNIWTCEIDIVPANYQYIYEIDHHKVLDPYAKSLTTSNLFGDTSKEVRCEFTFDHKFSWWGAKKPNLPKNKLVIYELHIRSFTRHETSNTDYPGTYLGVIEKIPYLKKLGINAVEILPVQEFDETENPRKDPETGKKLHNVWGYMTTNFFSPMKRYATTDERLRAIHELKTMVRELHKNGIEVIMDVVYNHVGRASSLELIDKDAYFLLNQDKSHTNYSGCGNTLNANSPATSHLIIHSLRYFAEEFQIDGFRFDLAGCFVRDKDLEVLHNPPIFDLISKDPILKDVKIILEPWDAAGINLLHGFHIHHFSSWNYAFKIAIRKFLRKDAFQEQFFKDSFLGSKYLFTKHSDPTYSINYVTCHDGFSLYDLVSYSHKNNHKNGENNRDGENDNISFNCGAEGITESEEIQLLRKKQMMNFLFATLLSFGIPMIRMGDEYGHTNLGNNNMYAQDELSWFLWNQNIDIKDFISNLIEIRNKSPLYQENLFLSNEDVEVLELSHHKVIILIRKKYLFCFNSSNSSYYLDEKITHLFECVITTDLSSSKHLNGEVGPNTFLFAHRKT
jgi:isoamylase